MTNSDFQEYFIKILLLFIRYNNVCIFLLESEVETWTISEKEDLKKIKKLR